MVRCHLRDRCTTHLDHTLDTPARRGEDRRLLLAKENGWVTDLPADQVGVLPASPGRPGEG